MKASGYLVGILYGSISNDNSIGYCKAFKTKKDAEKFCKDLNYTNVEIISIYHK